MEQTSHQSQHKARYERVLMYMKKPEFLLLLGLVNLLLLVCMSSRIHKMMHFGKMQYGQQHMYMMGEGRDKMRGLRDYKMQKTENQDIPMNNETTPEDTTPTNPEQSSQPATVQ